jgi:hypothetical protein
MVARQLSGSDLMPLLQRRLLAFFLCWTVLAVAPRASRAGDEDELTSKLRTAWEKFTELTEVGRKYGERGNLALTILDLEHYRANVEAAVRNLQIQVDGFPGRRNNLQQEVYQELLGWRSELTATDRNLYECRLQMRELDERAFREAEQRGEPVKNLNRRDLLQEFQRLDRESYQAFVSLRDVLSKSAEEQRLAPGMVLKKAINQVLQSGDKPKPLLPSKQFYAQVEQLFGKPFLLGKKLKKSARGNRRNMSAR